MNKLSVLPIGMVAIAVGCAAPTKYPNVRPPELDHLDAWIGEWESTGEVRPAGSDKVLKSRGHESITWESGKRFVLERMTWETEGAPKEEALAVRTWDPHGRVYRSWYFDSQGMVGHSKMTYDEKTKTWTGQTKNNDPETCEPTAGTITIKQPDADTMEWEFVEYDRLMVNKRVEMKGTSRRKR